MNWLKQNRAGFVVLYILQEFNFRRQDFRTVQFIYLIRIHSVHIDQVYREQYIRKTVKILLSIFCSNGPTFDKKSKNVFFFQTLVLNKVKWAQKQQRLLWMLTFTWIRQINRCHVLCATWTTSLTCVEVAGFVKTLPVGVHSARRLGCLRLKVPNITKFFVNRFYFVVIFCVQRIACRTKFMHLFGNLWVWDAGRAVRWIIGGMQLVCYNYYLRLYAIHLHGPLTILLLYPDGWLGILHTFTELMG